MGFFFSSRGRHTRFDCDWSSDVCSSDLDLRNVRALEEVSEQRDELRALARCPSLPVTAEAPLRDLREVENLVGDPAERGPTLRRLRVVLERGIPEDLQDAVDPAVELIGRWARPGARTGGNQQSRGECETAPHVDPLYHRELSTRTFEIPLPDAACVRAGDRVRRARRPRPRPGGPAVTILRAA